MHGNAPSLIDSRKLVELVQISGVTSWAAGISAFTSVAPLVVLATDTDPA